MTPNPPQTTAEPLPPVPGSALHVAALVAQARDLLAQAVDIIEHRKTFPGGAWKEGMRTRGEGEGKYRLREALVTLRSKADWLKQDAAAPNGGWSSVSDQATEGTAHHSDEAKKLSRKD